MVFNTDSAPDISAGPTTFFTETCATDGLETLLALLAKRYVGKATGEFSGKDGLLSLDTVFGGGKTHSQIAAYHFSKNLGAIEDLDQYIPDEETRQAFTKVTDGLSIRTAVFEGGFVSTTDAKCNKDDPNAPDTQTMWGELAYQLGGAEGYA